MNENLTPLRPAIKSQSAPNSPSDEAETKVIGRRVNFPADDMLVTGYLEPPNPWEKAINSTPDELTGAYRAACEKHQIKPLGKVLNQLQNINSVGEREECLSLKGEKLDSKQYEAMEEIFKRIQFTTIDVESTNLDDEGSVALFDMIEYYESASNLNISSNRSMTARGWQACARMLKKTKCLESLSAQNASITEQFMSLLCKTLRSGSYLTVLHLENSNISGRTCTLLMQALKLNTSLKELYLAENKLTSTDALQIGNLFRSNNKLELLDLRNNHIQDSGVSHIVHGLNDQSMGPEGGLRTLVLLSNQLTFHTSSHLAKAIVSTKTLESLNIGNNNITNEGIFLLKDSLMKNRTLHHLGLMTTRLTCEGAVALAEYIADNPCIQHIDLLENNIKVAGLLALSLSMKVNKSITRLDIDKDYKKESKKELQEQHQQLLLEIMECCERNHQEAEKIKKEEEENALKREKEKSEASNEKFSESVCRLLSLWDPQETISPINNVTKRSNFVAQNNVSNISSSQAKVSEKKVVGKAVSLDSAQHSPFSYKPSTSPSLPITSTPVIVLPTEEKMRSTKGGTEQEGLKSSINPALLSPPTVHPSPPKSRFRVSRVLDSDSVPSSAGNTPMPSPVPSPGHTPMPSPGSTPLSSPVPSPTGSPITSPHHYPCASGIVAPPSSPVKLWKAIANPSPLSHERKIHFNKIPCFVPGCSQHSSDKFAKDKYVENSEISLCSNPSSPVDIANGNCAPPSSPIVQPSIKDKNYNKHDEFSSSTMPFHSSPKDSESSSASHILMENNSVLFNLDSNIDMLGSTPPPNTPFEKPGELQDIDSSSTSSLESIRRFSPKSSTCKSLSWTDSLNDNDVSFTSESSSPSCMSDSCMNLSYWSTESDKTSSVPTLSEHVCKNDCTCCDISGSMPSLELNSAETSPIPASHNSQDVWINDYQQNYQNHSDLTSSSTSFIQTSSSSCAESDSYISADSGLATPDSADNSIKSFSSHSEDLAFPVDNVLVVDTGGPGSLAPPSTPIDYEPSVNNSYYSTSSSDIIKSNHIDIQNREIANSLKSLTPMNGEAAADFTSQNVIEKNNESNYSTTEALYDSVISTDMLVSTDEQEHKHDLEETPRIHAKHANSSLASYTQGPFRSVSDSNLKTNLNSLQDDGLPLSETALVSKYSKSRRSDSLLTNQNNDSVNKIREIKLAEPSCVRLFGGGLPAHTTINQPYQQRDSVIQSSEKDSSLSKEQKIWSDDVDTSMSLPLNTNVTPVTPKVMEDKSNFIPLNTDTCANHLNSENKSSESKASSSTDLELLKQVISPVLSSQKSKEQCEILPQVNNFHEKHAGFINITQSSTPKNNGVCRRASTGSFPSIKADVRNRRISFAVDELIQKQLIELHNSSMKMKTVQEESPITLIPSDSYVQESTPEEEAIKNNDHINRMLNESQMSSNFKEPVFFSEDIKCIKTENNYKLCNEQIVGSKLDSSAKIVMQNTLVHFNPEFVCPSASTFDSQGTHELNSKEKNIRTSLTVKDNDIFSTKLTTVGASETFQEQTPNYSSHSELFNCTNSSSDSLNKHYPDCRYQETEFSTPFSVIHSKDKLSTVCSENNSNALKVLCNSECDNVIHDKNIETDLKTCNEVMQNDELQLMQCSTVTQDLSDYSPSVTLKHSFSSPSSSSIHSWFHTSISDHLDNDESLVSVNANVNPSPLTFTENLQETDQQCNSAQSEINRTSSSNSFNMNASILEHEDNASLSNFTNRISGPNAEGGPETLKT